MVKQTIAGVVLFFTFGLQNELAAQGKYAGGKGGGAALANVEFPQSTGPLRPYPNPAPSGSWIRLGPQAATAQAFSIDGKQLHLVVAEEFVILNTKGYYILKFDNQCVKLVTY